MKSRRPRSFVIVVFSDIRFYRIAGFAGRAGRALRCMVFSKPCYAFACMPDNHFDLAAAACREMLQEGFHPDFPPGTDQQLAALRTRVAPAAARDLRSLLWSSIDNDSSRDLDQIEVADRLDSGTRIRIGIADVDADVETGSPIDRHAAEQTTTVYTGVKTFSMLPEQLSTDLTSLNEEVDRAAIVVEMVVG